MGKKGVSIHKNIHSKTSHSDILIKDIIEKAKGSHGCWFQVLYLINGCIIIIRPYGDYITNYNLQEIYILALLVASAFCSSLQEISRSKPDLCSAEQALSPSEPQNTIISGI